MHKYLVDEFFTELLEGNLAYEVMSLAIFIGYIDEQHRMLKPLKIKLLKTIQDKSDFTASEIGIHHSWLDQLCPDYLKKYRDKSPYSVTHYSRKKYIAKFAFSGMENRQIHTWTFLEKPKEEKVHGFSFIDAPGGKAMLVSMKEV